MSTIILGNGVKQINASAFSGCIELLDLYCYTENVPSIVYDGTTYNAFVDSFIETATLHVPSSSVDLYKGTTPWNNFKEIVAINDQDTSISDLMECDNSELTRYTIGGLQTSKYNKGLNIIRMSNGKAKKVFVK